MPSINVGEADFNVLAAAAQAAESVGHLADARLLDKLARKINAALSNARGRKLARHAGDYNTPMTWLEVPSVLGLSKRRSPSNTLRPKEDGA